jgi:hypothetical protein
MSLIKADSYFKDNHRALENNLNASISALKLAEQNGKEDYIYIINIIQFCTLFK